MKLCEFQQPRGSKVPCQRVGLSRLSTMLESCTVCKHWNFDTISSASITYPGMHTATQASQDDRRCGGRIIHQNSVRVHNCIEAMCNGEDGTVNKLLSERLLDDSVGPATQGTIRKWEEGREGKERV